MISITKVKEDLLHDDNDTYSGTGADAFSAAQAFEEAVREVVLSADDYGAIFLLSRNGTNWGEDILVPADFMLTITYKVHSWKVKNATDGENTEYRIVGFYQTT